MVYRQICEFMIVSMLAVTGASAAERSWTVSGQSLNISGPCAKAVSIEPSADLQGKIEVQASAEHQQEIDRLSITGGSAATIEKNTEHCYSGSLAVDIGSVSLGFSNFKPTLKLTVRVPAGIAIGVKDGGSGDYSVGAVGGPLDVKMSGSGELHAVNATKLNLALSGSGSATIDDVSGMLASKQSGSGNVTLGRVSVSTSEVALSGSGHFSANDGNAGQVSAKISGSGHLHLPDVGGLELATAGSGDSVIRRDNGAVEAKLAGSGKLIVKDINADTVSLRTAGSNKVDLGGGNIGNLTVASAGSSNIAVDAMVGDASVSIMGSGDVNIPHVTGHVSQTTMGSGRISVGGH